MDSGFEVSGPPDEGKEEQSLVSESDDKEKLRRGPPDLRRSLRRVPRPTSGAAASTEAIGAEKPAAKRAKTDKEPEHVGCPGGCKAAASMYRALSDDHPYHCVTCGMYMKLDEIRHKDIKNLGVDEKLLSHVLDATR